MPPLSQGNIFLCYRREDSADITGRFYDRLVQHFGHEMIFKDVDSIPLGVDFRSHIDQTIQRCRAVIVVIGDRWLEAIAADGQRRLDQEQDRVRMEIQFALARDVPIVPLLVRDAKMPAPKSLPEPLRELVYRHGAHVRSDPHFHSDVSFVIGRLEEIFDAPNPLAASMKAPPVPDLLDEGQTIPASDPPLAARPRAGRAWQLPAALVLLLVLGLVGSYLWWRWRPAPEWHKPALLAPEDIRLSFPNNPRYLHEKTTDFVADKWGYVDGLGRKVIAAQWDGDNRFSGPGNFHEGFAAVRSGGRCGYLDLQGHLAIPARWEDAEPFSEGFAVVGGRNQSGYLDRTGKLAISAQRYDDPFSEGLAGVSRGDKYGYLDRAGRLAIPAQWDAVSAFQGGLAAVKRGTEWCYIDHTGRIAISGRWKDVGPFREGLAAVSDGDKWGYIDVTGKLVIPLQWDSADEFSEGLALVGLDVKVRVAGPQRVGEPPEPPRRETKRNWGYCDRSGKLVIPAEWEYTTEFADGVAWVSKSFSAPWGCIDRRGAVVIPFEWVDVRMERAEDGRVYFQLVRLKPGSVMPSKKGESVPAEVRWVDATGRVIWQSP